MIAMAAKKYKWQRASGSHRSDCALDPWRHNGPCCPLSVPQCGRSEQVNKIRIIDHWYYSTVIKLFFTV